MSMMEIYNEAVFDLLAPSPTKDGGRRSSSGVGDKEKTSLDIRQNKAGGSSVQGLTEVRKKLQQHRIYYLYKTSVPP